MTVSRSPAKRNAEKRRLEEEDVVKPKWVEKFKRPKVKSAKQSRGKKKKTGPEFEYRIVWNPERETWDITLNGNDTGVFGYEKGPVTGLAIRDAQYDHPKGSAVAVSVQQKDGSFKLEWSR